MQSFSAFLFSDNGNLNFRCQCGVTMYTYAVAPSSIRAGWWQRHTVLLRRLIPQKVTVHFLHQTSYLSHVLTTVPIKSQFDIYFTNTRNWIKLSYTWSKLNEGFLKFRSNAKCSVHIHKAQVVKCWECLTEFNSKHFVSPPSPNPN
jgi:hypothetical protein